MQALAVTVVGTIILIILLSLTRNEIMNAIEELKASVETYIAAVNALIEQHKLDVAQAIAEAIAADDAAEEVDLQALKEQIDAANDALVVPPPPFEPSNL